MLYNANTSEKREKYFLNLICLIWGVDGGGGVLTMRFYVVSKYFTDGLKDPP